MPLTVTLGGMTSRTPSPLVFMKTVFLREAAWPRAVTSIPYSGTADQAPTPGNPAGQDTGQPAGRGQRQAGLKAAPEQA